MSTHNASKVFRFIASAMLAASYAQAQSGSMTAPSAAPAASTSGQSSTPQIEARTRPQAYEVVSVKPSQPGCPGMSIGMNGSHFSARCITVWGLLFNAYAVRSFRDHPPGLPGWADSARFDVEAKIDANIAAAMQKLSDKQGEEINNHMLQALLADRFKLRVHYETRIETIDQLVIAKSGPRLKLWPAEQRQRGTSWSDNQVTVQGGGMAGLVTYLSNVLSRKVVDATGLTGDYDISLKWTPDDKQGTPDAGPTLFTALDELGLKLKEAKGPVDTLVVDHVEKPSEN